MIAFVRGGMLVVVGLRCGLCPWAGCDDASGDGDDGHDSSESGDLEADGDSEGMVKEFRTGPPEKGSLPGRWR
ncbi:MAG TPA: hypothetical protein ENK31_05065 [Nannocystis exedens]|nr:hypothetical protein [Nannocystis exedens]